MPLNKGTKTNLIISIAIYTGESWSLKVEDNKKTVYLRMFALEIQWDLFYLLPESHENGQYKE